MSLRIASWNINSVRLRLDLVRRFIAGWSPDVLCLQETKARNPVFPKTELETLGYTQARRTDAASADELDAVRGIEVMARNDGTLLVLAPDKWRISVVERDHPDLTLEPLLAGDR